MDADKDEEYDRKNAVLVVSLFLGSGLPAATSRLEESGGKEIAPKSAGKELISVVNRGALGYSAETRLPLNPILLALSPPCVRILAHQAYFIARSLYVASPFCRLIEMLI
ncbi:unnamed protein product [Clavelina lepadiformis]|uniref:Uncharacterized protein n=1 Tax=Clavelina lepadiformis TaxID=159417 RepID=A0ABP0G7M1_CLALP